MNNNPAGQLHESNAYQVDMNTPVGTQVWVANRGSGSFAKVSTIRRQSRTAEGHQVINLDGQDNDGYRFATSELKLVTNARLPYPPAPFPPLAQTVPLTPAQARDLVHSAPQLFIVDSGQPPTVDTNLPDQALQLQLNQTHVRVVPGTPYNNCLDWAVGGEFVLLNDLRAFLDRAEARGLQVLPIGDPGADVDLWGEPAGDRMTVLHGTRLVPQTGGLWASVTGTQQSLFVFHTRYALAGAARGAGYGQVIASLRGPRVQV